MRTHQKSPDIEILDRPIIRVNQNCDMVVDVESLFRTRKVLEQIAYILEQEKELEKRSDL